eukprot:gene13640-18401_t
MLIWGLYGLAALLQLGVPDTRVRYPACARRLGPLLQDFRQGNRLLWRDPEGGLSLAVTTLFWGVGATLQFAVLRWALDRLGLPLEKAAYLQAVVAVGVVLGAGCAGRLVPLARASGQRLGGMGAKTLALVALGAVTFALDLASWHIGIQMTRIGNATLFGNAGSIVLLFWGFIVHR